MLHSSEGAGSFRYPRTESPQATHERTQRDRGLHLGPFAVILPDPVRVDNQEPFT